MMRWVILIILILSVPVNVPAQDSGVPTDLEIEVHLLINEVRADKEMHNQDLRPLKLHSVLIDVARDHSRDMLENDYFDHINLEGEEPADRVSDAGIEWNSVGENLFLASGYSDSEIAEVAVDGWVNSPGHYANIITGYTYTGIGIARSGDIFYITQVFINADPGHLEDIGRIYENDELGNIQEESDEGFVFTARYASYLVIFILLAMGIYAGRKNDQYYGRRR